MPTAGRAKFRQLQSKMSGERKLSDLKVNVTSRGLISTWSVDRTSVSDSTKKAMDSYPTKNTFKFKFQPQAKPEFKSVKAHLNNSPQQGLAKVTHLPKKEVPAKDVKDDEDEDPFDDDMDSYLACVDESKGEPSFVKNDVKISSNGATTKSSLTPSTSNKTTKRGNDSARNPENAKIAREDDEVEKAVQLKSVAASSGTGRGFVPPRSLLDTKNGSGFDLAIKILEVENAYDPALKGLVKNDAQILYLKQAIDKFNAAIFLHKFGIE